MERREYSARMSNHQQHKMQCAQYISGCSTKRSETCVLRSGGEGDLTGAGDGGDFTGSGELPGTLALAEVRKRGGKGQGARA